MNNQNVRRRTGTPAWLWMALASILFLWIAYGSLMVLWPFEAFHNLDERYHLAGSFEPLHALLEAFGLSGVIIALWLERRDARERHVEFSMQLAQQTFFGYLPVFRHYVDSLSEGNKHGGDCIHDWLRILNGEVQERKRALKGKATGAEAFLDVIWTARRKHALPYFQHIHNLLEIAQVVCLQQTQREHFAALVIAQLTESEQELLAYYCKTKDGHKTYQLLRALEACRHFSEDVKTRVGFIIKGL